ncbi:hydantoinase/oxoprolinase family protein [Salinicoccus sp. ID82-1]|uniref:hydantoinase/oxoprolinase family protein n=1 Tax=Salinicoccus sp. ID82-1 TaxID=2820269 RepID=UPI001F40AF49|nr:hydantoinase/oxoprolinase family protein [Salinicoccus sp. ID82-1]MCG1008434.1 hydantoinase/oxoprolinase family protein [Salinicoccus sp. ID82-1]
MRYKLGIDVGGTNTDGVILDSDMNVLTAFKHPTTDDIETGIAGAVEALLKNSRLDKSLIDHGMLGTTQCTNAIVTRKSLNDVGVIRIGAPAGTAIEPIYSMPDDLKAIIGQHVYQVRGGHEFNGELIAELDEAHLEDIARELKGKVNSIAISSIFSPVNKAHETRAKEIIEAVVGEDVAFSLSSEIGSISLLERENATVLNAAIINVAKKTTEGFEKALKQHGVDCEVYFCQNDGTLMSKEYTLKYPILTVACGPTNSLRGASFLSNHDNAIIADIGGTTTDIGVLNNGFPRESSLSVELGGVQTNFRMPDIYSLALGGGTIITLDGEDFKIGPDSVGYRLPEKAKVFGGDTLTVTDIAVAKGILSLGDAEKVKDLDTALVDRIYDEIINMIEVAIERMKTSDKEVPVVLVGGGSTLIEGDIEGASEVINPENSGVANAIGSAISDISGEVEKIYKIDPSRRNEILDEIKQFAIDEAVNAGADKDRTEIISFEDIPLAYLPGNATRIKVKAAGPLKED